MAARPKTSGPSRQVKLTFAISLVIILIGSGVFLALGGPTGMAEHPGIFGTKANLFSDLNLIAQIVLLLGLSLGFVFAHQGNITAHQYNQTAWVLFNIVLTIFIMIVAYVEYILPGMPSELNRARGIVSTIHAIIGLIAIGCGVYIILRMNKLIPKNWRNRNWKQLMQVTLVLYWVVGLLGIALYYFWYVQ